MTPALAILALLGFLAVFYILIRPIIRGAIYFPSSDRNMDTMLRFADAGPGKKMADLGSGDGRVLVALARAGAEAHGYEINPLLVYSSRRAIRQAGLSGKAFVHWESFWRVNFAPYDAVLVYAFPRIMRGLEKKLQQELRPGARVIANIYPFPTWEPARTESKVFLYVNENGRRSGSVI